MNLPATARINVLDHLEIGGVDLLKLAAKFGTPLYVLDEATIRKNARAYLAAFKKHYVRGRYAVAFASKALCQQAVAKIMADESLWLDVVSGGELFTARLADFPAEKIIFHGNNKSEKEIDEALAAGVGYFAIDNLCEFHRLFRKAASRDIQIRAFLRIVPEIKAETHSHIITGHKGSKFGLKKEEAEFIVNKCRTGRLEIVGLHAHIGSQIFDLETFETLAEKMVQLSAGIYKKTGVLLPMLNLGGGLGVGYLTADIPPTIEAYVKTLAAAVKNSCKKFDLPLPFLTVEPGRSLVAAAGVTLYTIGSIKKEKNIRLVAVDGGMSDNPRPITYDAAYEAMIPANPRGRKTVNTALVGKFCESGDILIKNIKLPEVCTGEIIMVPVTGAYNYSMASRYNRTGVPAMVLVNSGRSAVIVQREDYAALTARDRWPGWFNK